ncbi:MAG TPA: NERD domain-containing protein [Phycisphaerae bacterium]|nr:NERD domain-containing protein [Phycisphaerae bacterium]
MIAKAKTSQSTGKFGEAGDAAERQMAYYLERDFGSSPNVQLFHDLRIEHKGHAAQIDHLIIHRYGMVIVESKSISGRVQINAHGEWIRFWGGGRKQGMASPIQQAKLQRDLLLDLLEDHAEQLLDKVLAGLVQARFGGCPFMLLVAISDHGIIERKGANPPEVMKADQICDRIYEEAMRHKRSRLTLCLKDPDYGMYRINAKEMKRLTDFLVSRHTPLRPEMEAADEAAADAADDPAPPVARPARAAETNRRPQRSKAPNGKAPARKARTSASEAVSAEGKAGEPGSKVGKSAGSVAASAPSVAPQAAPGAAPANGKPGSSQPANGQPAPAELVCRHCASGDIYVTNGRYGYYFKCRACEGNTPIDYTCTACGKKGRIGKSGLNFDRVCTECGSEERVWVNRAED